MSVTLSTFFLTFIICRFFITELTNSIIWLETKFHYREGELSRSTHALKFISVTSTHASQSCDIYGGS